MISFAKELSTKFHFLVNSAPIFHIFKQSPCLLCDEITLNASKVCDPCLTDLHWNNISCPQCALPLGATIRGFESDELLCGDCLQEPPPFTSTVSPFVYAFPINTIIHKVKYGKEQFWIKPLASMFSSFLLSHNKRELLPDLLTPVPLHKNKLKERGFNQSELLSKQLSRQLGIPYLSNLISKTRDSDNQASLSKKQRLKNLKGCFSMTPDKLIMGKHIALVDDVMTTKATSELCARLLIDNGAERVDIWCLARTPKD